MAQRRTLAIGSEMRKITRSTKAIVFLLIALFMGTSVVAADYIGPQRTYQIDVPSSCHYTYSGSGAACAGYPSNPVSCTCNIYCDSCLRPDLSCSGVSPGQVEAQCGHKDFSQTDFELVYTTITRSYPIAEANTIWSCPIPGSNGWCHSPFPVQLYGVDNYASEGYYITALEGILDGIPFFADAVDTIAIQINEGTHHLDFWALSSYGDSSYHFIENYYVDTVNPVINASLNGTPGEHDWFVSNTTLTVTFTDPTPGSGVDYTRALSNGADFSVVTPVIFTEGIYALQLEVRDFAGHNAQTLYTLMVDTTPPAVTANQPPVELAVDGIAGGGYVNGSVVFTGTCSDATSGVDRIEISTDGSALTFISPNPDGTWTLDWDSSMLSDGTYTPVITAVDAAGNRTDITMLPLTLDNSAPAMSITGGWYIWDSGHIEVYDSRAGIQRIELSVRDDQNRWPAREWDYDTSKLEMDLQWDRKFGDGTIAPPGRYDVLLQAWDRLGNGRWLTAHIYIPEAGATAVIPYEGMLTAGNVDPTGTPVPTQSTIEETPHVAVGGGEAQQTNTLVPTSTTVAVPISGGEDSTAIIASSDNSGDHAPANTTPISDGILWGAAAVAAGAAAALVSQKQLKETRAKEEEKIWESIKEAIAKRWEQTVAGVVAWNKAVAEAEAEIQAEQQKWLKAINDTNGDVLNNLSEEEFIELMQTNKGANLAVTEFIEQQKLAQQLEDEKSEQAEKTQSYFASKIAAYQAEQKGSIESRLTRMEEETADRNVIDVVETNNSPTFTTILANLLNKASSGLGVLHDTVGVPIENKADSVNKSIVDLYYSGKETVLNWKDKLYSLNPEKVKTFVITTGILTMMGGSAMGACALTKGVGNDIHPTDTLALSPIDLTGTAKYHAVETDLPNLEKTWEVENVTKTFQFELTETAKFFTPEPDPVNNPDLLNTNINLWLLANSLDPDTSEYCQQQVNNLETQACKDLFHDVYEYQNKFNEIILEESYKFSEVYSDIDPILLAVMYKRTIINESQFVPGVVTGDEKGTGIGQVTPATLDTLVGAKLISLPDGVINDEASVMELLHDPEFVIKAGIATLIYNYQGVKNVNQKHNWEMNEEDMWRFTLGLYNVGPQSSGAHAQIDWSQHDFYEASRMVVEKQSDFYETYFCNDPNSWDCIKYLFPNKEKEGRCTILYAESVVPDGLINDPTSSEYLNINPYNREECE